MLIGLVMRLLSKLPSPGYSGTGSFRMFTIDSNCVVGICALLAIPYQVDGIRNGYYRIPKWIIYTLYVGVSCTTLTMMTTLLILGPGSHWSSMLFTHSNLIFHIVLPILAILLFVLVMSEHRVKFNITFIAMAPVIIYALVYIVMVFLVGEENGGWADHYKFGTYIPWPISFLIMIGLDFGLCTGLRVLHNLAVKKQKVVVATNYKKAMDDNHLTTEQAVAILAKESQNRWTSVKGSVYIPRRVIAVFVENGHSEKSVADLCHLYLEKYLDVNNVYAAEKKAKDDEENKKKADRKAKRKTKKEKQNEK